MLNSFVDNFLISFDYADSINKDDISLKFDGNASNKQLILSHIFTIPFQTTKHGLKRLPEWIKPLEHWNSYFIGKQLTSYTLENNQLNLEFDGELILLSCDKLVSVWNNQNSCLWTTMQDLGMIDHYDAS